MSKWNSLNKVGKILKRKFTYAFARFYSDRKFLETIFPLRMGYPLNLDNPKTFSEKLQWLKLNDRKPIYTKMVDKAEAKKYVADIIGEEYIIPTLGVYDRVEDIDFDSLPNRFVLKCTHDSGGLVICRDKTTLDKKAAIKKLKRSLKRNYFYQNREWPYKNVNPRIIAEQYMEDNQTLELRNYNFFYFDRVLKALFLASERQAKGEETKFDFFDADFRHLDIGNGHPDADMPLAKPETFDKMKKVAEKLSKHFPHLQVDFYEVNGMAYFGEFVFSHWSRMMSFEPEKWDIEFGQWITLPDADGGGDLFIAEGLVIYLHEKKDDLVDYKFYCFNGEPRFCQVIQDRHTNETIDFFDMEWNHQEFVGLNPAAGPAAVCPQKPERFELMKEMARKLCGDNPFVRVDLYEINRKAYFGEITFYPASGMGVFTPNNYSEILGKMLNLSGVSGGG